MLDFQVLITPSPLPHISPHLPVPYFSHRPPDSKHPHCLAHPHRTSIPSSWPGANPTPSRGRPEANRLGTSTPPRHHEPSAAGSSIKPSFHPLLASAIPWSILSPDCPTTMRLPESRCLMTFQSKNPSMSLHGMSVPSTSVSGISNTTSTYRLQS